MIYITSWNCSYPSLDDWLYSIIEETEEPEYALYNIEEAILIEFPLVNIKLLYIEYEYWLMMEGPYKLGWDYNFEYETNEFKKYYPELFI